VGITISTTPQVVSSLNELRDTGSFGKTREEVAEYLLPGYELKFRVAFHSTGCNKTTRLSFRQDKRGRSSIPKKNRGRNGPFDPCTGPYVKNYLRRLPQEELPTFETRFLCHHSNSISMIFVADRDELPASS
jgi:hypothetical protein